MFCAQCGSRCHEGATSCPTCGAPVSTPPDQSSRITVDVSGVSNPGASWSGGPPTPPEETNQRRGALETKGFLASLFDFEFTSFVAQGVLRVVYVLFTILYSLLALGLLVMCLASGSAIITLGGLIVVPLLYVLYLAMARVWTEMIMVLFVIGSDLRAVRETITASNTPPGY